MNSPERGEGILFYKQSEFYYIVNRVRYDLVVNLDTFVIMQKRGMTEVIEDERLDDNCHHLVAAGYEGETYYMVTEYIWFIRGKGYMLAYYADYETYQKNKKLAKKILGTFKLKIRK